VNSLGSIVGGCTFDDFLFAPQRSVVERRDPAAVDVGGRFSEHVPLRYPIVAANMDTVTRSGMAIVLAEEGGLGVIDRGYRDGDIAPQVHEVSVVKRRQPAVIGDPYTIPATSTLEQAAALMQRSSVGTLMVTDEEHRLLGLLSERDLRFVDLCAPVAERMTPKDRLVVYEGLPSPETASELMARHKLKKLPLVDRDGRLAGLVTAKDLLRQQQLPFATRDDQGRLRVGAAIGARGDYLERAEELIRAGADVIVIDIAHGHSVVMDRAIGAFRRRFGDFEVVAGNVATVEGVRFLVERGVNGIKVGIGPGGGCTTRINTGFGVPQVQALVACREAVGTERRVPLIADGGVHRDGAFVQALLFGGDAVMLGSAFAGTIETPGEIVQKPVLLPESRKPVQVPFKVLRGMASISAIRDRLDLEDAADVDLGSLAPEGVEISVPLRGSARAIVREMVRHLCSAVSYGGTSSLAELRNRFWAEPERYLIRLSEAARVESYER